MCQRNPNFIWSSELNAKSSERGTSSLRWMEMDHVFVQVWFKRVWLFLTSVHRKTCSSVPSRASYGLAKMEAAWNREVVFWKGGFPTFQNKNRMSFLRVEWARLYFAQKQTNGRIIRMVCALVHNVLAISKLMGEKENNQSTVAPGLFGVSKMLGRCFLFLRHLIPIPVFAYQIV